MAISVEEALNFIYSNVKTKKSELLPIENVLGRILFEDITATHNLPPYDNSAMDGYAVKVNDSNSDVNVMETIFAGDDKSIMISDGEVVKIMTGARIPEGCEAVVPKENTTQSTSQNENSVTLPQNIKAGQHIRLCGEDIQSGDTLLEVGQQLHAHHVKLLASQGISHIKVFKKPRIALFASGNELRMHFETLQSHQLYNTNTPTIMARCVELHCDVEFIGTAHDNLESLQDHIKSAMDCDFIITSGGVSVGDADFTKEAFEMFNVEVLFDKINIKPGKPTTFGLIKHTNHTTYVLNLPGNPLAAALNFELFAQSTILAMSGNSEKYLLPIETKMKDDYRVKAGRRALIPGYFNGKDFEPIGKFAPGMVSPLASANSFIMIDETVASLEKGSSLKIIPTQWSFSSKIQENLVTKN
jgi:molybdopterin molybdotransferase